MPFFLFFVTSIERSRAMYEYDIENLIWCIPRTGVSRGESGITVVQFHVPNGVNEINHRIETRAILNKTVNIDNIELAEIMHKTMKEHIHYIMRIFDSEEIKYKDGIQTLLFEARVF